MGKKQRRARGELDVDIEKHIDELDKRQLKSTGWIVEPLDNVEHDFVPDLLKRYLGDLEQRKRVQNDDEAGFCKNLRKVVDLDTMEEVVNMQYAKISSLREKADKREEELEYARKKAEHDKKIAKIVLDKVEFKKHKAFQRKNSYVPHLEDFGDIDDQDAVKKNVGKVRRSIDAVKRRAPLQVVVKDVMQHRLEKDIMAASITDSQVGESGGFRGSGRFRGGGASAFKRRTTDEFNTSGKVGGIQMGGQQLELPAP